MTNAAMVHANACDQSKEEQVWDIVPEAGHIVLRRSGLCLDILGYATANESLVQDYACHPGDRDPSHLNHAWKYDAATGEIIASGTAEGMRLDCADSCSQGPGSPVWIFSKTGGASQKWRWDKTTGLIHSEQTKYANEKLCLDAGTIPPPPRPCEVEPGRSQPWCDASLGTEERLDDLLQRIPESDVPGLLGNSGKGVESLKIPPYQWWSEALHGVANSPGVEFLSPTLNATSFPQVVTTSMSFNTTLFNAIGQAISTEARAFSNFRHAGMTFWTPNINIFRDPRWGRGQETPGEDPTLNGEYASSFVPGMQEGESWPRYIKASACLKHFSGYSLENWGGVDRHHFDAIITKQDMHDTYLPAFEAGVKAGKASGLMCSYNAVNGVPSCADGALLTDLVRKQWDFDGYITSDCGAVYDVEKNHNYTSTPDDTCKAVLAAGMDSDCGGFLGNNLGAAIHDGSVTKEAYSTALRNLFRMRIRLGQFDPLDKQPYSKLGLESIDTPLHRALAREAAEQGIVLLKNINGVLPFSKASVRTLALVGPQGNATKTMQGNYFGVAPFLVSPEEGLSAYTTVKYEKGCDIDSSNMSGFGAAKSAAASSDATIIAIGLTQAQEAEGLDRTELKLPGVQHEFIRTVAAAAKGPVVLLLMCGGGVDISEHRDDPNIHAILFVGYPGQDGGTAIARTVFGDSNPSGRLTQTFYPESFAKKVSMFDMNMRSNAKTGYPGRTYRFYTGKPVFDFGAGLSYSKFAIHIMDSDGARTAVHVRVANEGERAGAETVLCFARAPQDLRHDGDPIRRLVAFKKVYLNPGEAKTLAFEVQEEFFALMSAAGERRSLPTVLLEFSGSTIKGKIFTLNKH